MSWLRSLPLCKGGVEREFTVRLHIFTSNLEFTLVSLPLEEYISRSQPIAHSALGNYCDCLTLSPMPTTSAANVHNVAAKTRLFCVETENRLSMSNPKLDGHVNRVLFGCFFRNKKIEIFVGVMFRRSYSFALSKFGCQRSSHFAPLPPQASCCEKPHRGLPHAYFKPLPSMPRCDEHTQKAQRDLKSHICPIALVDC